MNRRSISLAAAGLALVALVAAAVPAFGDDSVAPSLDRRASARALARAQRALGLSRQARRVARHASTVAAYARDRSIEASAVGEENRGRLGGLQTQVEAAGGRIGALEAQVKALAGQSKVASSTAEATVESTAPFGEYEALGGPAVDVTVPASGLIEVWAEVAVQEEDGGAVGLFEDGQRITGISAKDLCGDPSGIDDGSALIDMTGGPESGFMTAATPPTYTPFGCATVGAPSSVLLSRAPGQHSYELRYSECSCNPGSGAEFRDRTLRVAPRP